MRASALNTRIASTASRRPLERSLVAWTVAAWLGFGVLPWYSIDDGFWSFGWLWDGYPVNAETAPGLFQFFLDKPWLGPIALTLLLPALLWTVRLERRARANLLIVIGGGGLAYVLIQGFAIGIGGWEFAFLEALLGPLGTRQFGMGYGALLSSAALLFMLTHGIARRGAVGGDVFVVGSIGLVVALVTAFVFFPVSRVLVSALQDDAGVFSASAFAGRFLSDKTWGLRCLYSNVGCGAAWNSLFLAVLVGAGTTVLGLAFALIATRTDFRAKRFLRVLTVLPIITPPFVIGLVVILLFGRSGTVTQFASWLFDIPGSRWIYGLPGIWFAQMLAFTPIAFLVLIGVVEGVSPSMEEAALTLRADRWKTFSTVTLPLMRPGLANAFLLGFIESMADFGNPLVLGVNYDVL